MATEAGRAAKARYRDRNREKLRAAGREYQRNRRETDPEYVAAQRERMRVLRETNPEKLSEIRKRSYAKHADRRRAERREYYAADPERGRAARREWYQAHPEQGRAMAREWAKRNPEKRRENYRRWCAENREKKIAYDNRRRARKAGAAGSHTVEEFAWLCRLLGHRCFYCDKQTALTRDHAIPLIRGGSDFIDNIVPACKSCNSRKNSKTVSEFLGI